LRLNFHRNRYTIYVHSVTDYCVDIWTVQNDNRLSTFQDKINRFLINYFFPAIVKKCSLKKSYTSARNSINADELLNICNFLNIKERSDFVLLKNLYKRHNSALLVFMVRSINNPWPQLPVIRHSTSSYERSLEYRRRKLWNCLPKHWILNSLSYYHNTNYHQIQTLLIL
jgi:hypothetical protein